MGPMAARTNLSSTRRTVAALRRGSRLGPEHAALVALVETTGRALDELVESDEKRYVVAQLARAHLMATEALLRVGRDTPLDPFAAFVAGLSVPTPYTDSPDFTSSG
jgi:hypothetical protein